MNDKVTEYISKEVEWKRDILNALRDAIHQADPDIEEQIKWGAPSFYHNGQVAWMFCATDWVHFSYPQGALLDASHGRWEEDETSLSKAKRTLKFRKGEEVPVELILALTREAVENNLAGKKVDFNVPKAGTREFDLPEEYAAFLKEQGQYDAYLERPYYQQKGWIEWIEMAKQPETIERRRQAMIQQLSDGTYMPSKREE